MSGRMFISAIQATTMTTVVCLLWRELVVAEYRFLSKVLGNKKS